MKILQFPASLYKPTLLAAEHELYLAETEYERMRDFSMLKDEDPTQHDGERLLAAAERLNKAKDLQHYVWLETCSQKRGRVWR